MSKLTIDDIRVAGFRVLVRVDFNVPIVDGKIVDDRRIKAAIPTLKSLLQRGAKVIVVTHLGRPGGTVDMSLSVASLAKQLAELMEISISVADDVVGLSAQATVSGLDNGQLCMLENVRFEAGEEKNDPKFAAELAELADIYCNDAFGAAHRAHASTEGIAHLLPSVAGYLMASECSFLTKILHDPEPPVTAIIGGSKISTKFRVLKNLLSRVDALWVGGAMACTFYKAMGYEIGKSLVEDDHLSNANELLEFSKGSRGKLMLPLDLIVSKDTTGNGTKTTCKPNNVPIDQMVVDIGPKTIEAITQDCKIAKMIVWNGPLGVYEVAKFAVGTDAIAKQLAISSATTIVGGGDLGAAIDAAGVADKITHISTGGGATLEFLEGNQLPGLAILPDRIGAIDSKIGREIRPTVRKPLIVANWKMNTTVSEGLKLMEEVAESLLQNGWDQSRTRVVLLPPFTHLWPLAQKIAGQSFELGAQNAFWENSGAFTGEISPASLKELCQWLLLGHSERRQLFNEANDVINKKLKRALENSLQVILAVGETLKQRQDELIFETIRGQLGEGLEDIASEHLAQLVIAYEPIWAIGTGKTATPEQAQEVCSYIREQIGNLYNKSIAENLLILYGGSVTPTNALELFAMSDIDGALVGGVSLKAEDFAQIVAAAQNHVLSLTSFANG